jgi:hypothetical protein
MKSLLSLLAMMIAVNFSYAQWTTSGTNTTTTNNVGISTTSPLSPLTIGSNTTNIQSTTGITLGSGQNNIEFLNSTYGSGFGAKIYGVDSGSGITTLRIATRGNSTIWKDALTIYASASDNGNIGIGTTSPDQKLTLSAGTSTAFSQTQLGLYNPYTTNADVRNWMIASDEYSYGSFGIKTSSTQGGNPASGLVRFLIDKSGNIGIGTTEPKGHKLAVNGDIVATKVTVLPYGNWPDYVFKPAYNLPSLDEVKKYIDQNRHLPDVPSAATVKKDGQDLGEMNKILLKKVEELTLYLIEQKAEIKDLKRSQQKQIDELQSQVEQLLQQK